MSIDQTSGGPSTAGSPDMSVIEFLSVQLRARRTTAWIAVGCSTAMLAVVLMLPRTYTVRVAFMPNSVSSAGAVAGLAAQFGVALPMSGAGESPDFYAELAMSRGILASLVDQTYQVSVRRGWLFWQAEESVNGTLVDVLDVNNSDSREARERAIRRVGEMIDVSTAPLSGTVNIGIESRSPEVAVALGRGLLQLLDDFNQNSRQSQAGAERAFTADRLASAELELREAEGAQRQFLERNRTFQESPQLAFEHERLQREVVMRQQIYSSLLQAHEQARIEEVRNTPVITVVQEPQAPDLPDRRQLVLKALIAAVIGIALGAFWALAKESLTAGHADGARALREFSLLRTEALAELKRPWRVLFGKPRP